MKDANINELIPTRQSLLSRLKDCGDETSWKVFFDTYWRLIYNCALRAGLTDAEAQDAVQETIISVMKSMPGFKYHAENGSFKSWLLRLTSWRIQDQFRKRQRGIDAEASVNRTATGTAVIEQIADVDGMDKLGATWDEEWKNNLAEAAVERVKRKVDAKQFQVFDLYVLKNWPVSKVAKTLKVSTGSIYIAKHRINGLIKKEITYLQTKLV